MLQSDVANRIGTAVSTYAEYESGKKTPRPEKLIKLANLFNTSVDFLLGQTDEERSIDEIRYDTKSSTPDLNKILKETAPHWNGEPLTSEQANALIAFYETLLKQNAKKEEKS